MKIPFYLFGWAPKDMSRRVQGNPSFLNGFELVKGCPVTVYSDLYAPPPMFELLPRCYGNTADARVGSLKQGLRNSRRRRKKCHVLVCMYSLCTVGTLIDDIEAAFRFIIRNFAETIQSIHRQYFCVARTSVQSYGRDVILQICTWDMSNLLFALPTVC